MRLSGLRLAAVVMTCQVLRAQSLGNEALSARALASLDNGDFIAADKAFRELSSKSSLCKADRHAWAQALVALDRLKEAVAVLSPPDSEGGFSGGQKRVARISVPGELHRWREESLIRTRITDASKTLMASDQTTSGAGRNPDPAQLCRDCQAGHPELAEQLAVLSEVDRTRFEYLLDHPNELKSRSVSHASLARCISGELSRAHELLKSGRFDDAVAITTRLGRLIPAADLDVVARQRSFQLGLDAVRGSRLKEAIQLWSKVNESCPLGPVLLPQLAVIAWYTDRREEAESLLSDSLKALPQGQFSNESGQIIKAFKNHRGKVRQLTKLRDEAVSKKATDSDEAANQMVRQRAAVQAYLEAAALEAIAKESRIARKNLNPVKPGYYFTLVRSDEPGGYLPLGPFAGKELAEKYRKMLLEEKNPFTIPEFALTLSFSASPVYQVGSTKAAKDRIEGYEKPEDVLLGPVMLDLAIESHAHMMGYAVAERHEAAQKASDKPSSGSISAAQVAQAELKQLMSLRKAVSDDAISLVKAENELSDYIRTAPLVARAFDELRKAITQSPSIEGVEPVLLDPWIARTWQIERLLDDEGIVSAISDPVRRKLQLPAMGLPDPEILRDLSQSTRLFMDANLTDVWPTFVPAANPRVSVGRAFQSTASAAKFEHGLSEFATSQPAVREATGEMSHPISPWHTASIVPIRSAGKEQQFQVVHNVPVLATTGSLLTVSGKRISVGAGDAVPTVAMNRVFAVAGQQVSVLAGRNLVPLDLPLYKPELVGGDEDELLILDVVGKRYRLYRLRSDVFQPIANCANRPVAVTKIQGDQYCLTDGSSIQILEVGHGVRPLATLGIIGGGKSLSASPDGSVIAATEGGLLRIWPNGLIQRLAAGSFKSVRCTGSDVWALSDNSEKLCRFGLSEADHKLSLAMCLEFYSKGEALLREKNYAAAAGLLQEAIEIMPGCVPAEQMLSVVTLRRFPDAPAASLLDGLRPLPTYLELEESLRNQDFRVAEAHANSIWLRRKNLSSLEQTLLAQSYDRLAMPLGSAAVERLIEARRAETVDLLALNKGPE